MFSLGYRHLRMLIKTVAGTVGQRENYRDQVDGNGRTRGVPL